jgi:hypothetical protein
MSGTYGRRGLKKKNSRDIELLTLLTVENSYWFYAPNKGAPVAWVTFFAISGVVHTWQNMYVNIYLKSRLLVNIALVVIRVGNTLACFRSAP